MWGGQLGVKPI